MKQSCKVALLLALVLCMLFTVIPVSAAKYDWADGVLPENWEEENLNTVEEIDDVRATEILQPVNPNASKEARNLYAYLCTLTDSPYFVTGAFEYYPGSSNQFESMTTENGGVAPAMYQTFIRDGKINDPVFALDAAGNETAELLNGDELYEFYDPYNLTDKEKTFQSFINYYNAGHIILVQAGVSISVANTVLLRNKPAQYPTTFNAIVEYDQTNPDRDMQTYACYVAGRNHLIKHLKELENMGLKAYMLRTYVESNQYSNYGADDVGFGAFTRVFQQDVQAYIDGGLTGFLQTYSPGNTFEPLIHMNPGNSYLDIYGMTNYSDSVRCLGSYEPNRFASYKWYCNTGKPMGFTEWSGRAGSWETANSRPRGDFLRAIQDTLSYWPNVSFICNWAGRPHWAIDDNGHYGGNDNTRLYYAVEHMLTVDEIVDYRTTEIAVPGVVQLFTTADGSGKHIAMEEKEYKAADLKALGIDLTKIRSLRTNTRYGITFYTNDDCTGDSYGYGSSRKNISADIAANFKSCKVVRMDNLALNNSEIYCSVKDNNAWKLNDGQVSSWSADIVEDENVAEDGTAWFYIDLGTAHEVSFYRLYLSSYAEAPEVYNLHSFELQASDDAENWTTVNQVKNNDLGKIERYFTPTTARYFRILVTVPNSSTIDPNFVTVLDWELLGIEPGLLYTGATGTGDAEEEEFWDDDLYDDLYDEGDILDEEDPETDGSETEKKPNKRRKKTVVSIQDWTWIIVAIVAAVVVIAGGIVLFILLRRKKKKQLAAAAAAAAETAAIPETPEAPEAPETPEA